MKSIMLRTQHVRNINHTFPYDDVYLIATKYKDIYKEKRDASTITVVIQSRH